MIVKVRSASWASCLPLMLSSSHPGVVQFLLLEHHFKVRSGQLSSLQTNPVQGTLEVGINLRVNFPSVSLCMSQLRVPGKKKSPSIQVGDRPLNYVFFQSWLQVMRHLVFIQRQITEISFRNKLRVFFKNSVKFCINVT